MKHILCARAYGKCLYYLGCMTLFSGLMWKFLMVLSPPLDSPSSFLASNSYVPAESSCLLLLLGCLLPSWTIENDLSCLNCARVSIVICLARVFQGFFLHRFAPTQVSLKHDLTASLGPILLIYNLLFYQFNSFALEYYWMIHEKERKGTLKIQKSQIMILVLNQSPPSTIPRVCKNRTFWGSPVVK